jgi:hypothetical protein
MQLKNLYYYFKEAIPPETCQRIIDLGKSKLQEMEEKGESTQGVTFGDRDKQSMPDASPLGDRDLEEVRLEGQTENDVYVRDSNIAWLDDSWLYELFTPIIEQANIDAGWNWQIDSGEAFQFTVYNPGQFYGWHSDGHSDRDGAYKRYIHGVTPEPMKPNGTFPTGYTNLDHFIGKVRKISMTCNLNIPGDYEGGNLKFDFGNHAENSRYHECEEIRPQGSVICFPSFLPHCVTPVTSGTRYSLVLWSLGEPWK